MSKALENLDASIENQKKRLEQLKARKQQIEARLRSEEKKRARKEDTRRKILAGAFLLEMLGDEVLDFEVKGKTLKAFLIRSDDKALFGLVEGVQHETSSA
jgi:predicted RNase H-like nuclease (RuvC/YqgF family)